MVFVEKYVYRDTLHERVNPFHTRDSIPTLPVIDTNTYPSKISINMEVSDLTTIILWRFTCFVTPKNPFTGDTLHKTRIAFSHS